MNENKFKAYLGSALGIIGYGSILGLYISSLINPMNNLQFILESAVFIVLAEFLTIHSTGMAAGAKILPVKIFLIVLYTIFAIAFIPISGSVMPSIFLLASIIFRITFKSSEEFSMRIPLNIFAFLFTTFFVVVSYDFVKTFINFNLDNTTVYNLVYNTQFIESAEGIILWGIIYFGVQLLIEIFDMFKIRKEKIN